MNQPTTEEYVALTEEQLMKRRAERTRLRKERQRRRRIRRLLIAVPLLAVAVGLAVFFATCSDHPAKAQPVSPASAEVTAPEETPETPAITPLSVHNGSAAKYIGEDVISTYAVLIDGETGEVLASRSGNAVINPASMTKIMTVLTAADHIDDLNDTILFTQEMSDSAFLGGLSIAGFLPGERVTVADLLYGTILPSGADAAMGLAIYVSGSENAFVDLMNEKAAELGLSQYAHFTNCSGAYNENHHCTCEDLAIILKAAMDTPLCREVLSAHQYNTSLTAEHPEGIPLSNWFLRRIEDKDTGDIFVVGAKTGYVNEAGNCAASYGTDNTGHVYLCVTGDAYSAWRCIYDHVALYRDYLN